MKLKTLALAMLVLCGSIGAVGLGSPAQAARGPAGQASPADGCSKPAVEVVDQAATVDVDGVSRRYTWTASDRAGRKPLVLDLHGWLEGFFGVHPIMSQFSPKALAEGFVVAYPVGEHAGIDWDVSPTGPSLAFIDALLAKIEADACIDRDRIYVTGLSFGGFMSSVIMCQRSTVFAAAAPVAGLLDICGEVPRKIPVITFHGTSDTWVWYPLVEGSPRAWATKYGCGPVTRRTVTEADPVTGRPIYQDAWDCRAQHTAVESYVVDGGGHSWPGSWFSSLIALFVGRTPTSIDATDLIWDFFEQHSLRDG